MPWETRNMLNRIKIKQRLVLLFIVCTVVPLSAIGLFAYNRAAKALSTQSFAQLDALRAVKSGQMESYFGERLGDLAVLSENPIVTEALPVYAAAFKEGVNSSAYRAAQEKYGTLLASYEKTYGYYDLFLIDEEGNVVYTVEHEDDFGTNLAQGQYRTTGLADIFNNGLRGTAMTDVEKYAPSNDAPAAFLGGPVNGPTGRLIGVVALQIALDQVNGVMQERTGLGESGETYLVGEDMLLRSDSRFSDESTILKQKIDTVAAQEALAGKTDSKLINDYRGTPVLSSYQPIEVLGTKWAAIAEIDKAEAFGPVYKLRNILVLVIAVVAAAVCALGLVVARGISNPINAMNAQIEEIAGGGGDLTRGVSVNTQDELGEMAGNLNKFIAFLRDLVSQIKNIAVQVEGSSQQVAKASEDAGKASQQIAETIAQVAKGANEQTETVVGTAKSMEQLNAAVDEVAKGAQSQAETAQDANKQMTEISQAIEQVSKNSQAAAEGAGQVAQTAKAGGEVVQSTVEGMGKIAAASEQSGSNVRSLGDSSKQIGEIVEMITDIAEQTNLLALNAAIEAARAGEHGKGFAVVADEVRKLAERSANATKEIGNLIKGIQSGVDEAVASMEQVAKEVEQGTELSQQAGKSLEEILGSVDAVVGQAQEVSAASQQMSAGAAEVLKSVENISAVTEQSTASTQQMSANSGEVTKSVEQISAISEENAAAAQEVSAAAQEQNASVEEMAASAQEMAKLAGDLQELVGQFKTENGQVESGARAAGQAAAAEEAKVLVSA